MRVPTLVKRYAHGLVDACHDEAEFEAIFAELKELNRIFEIHPDLRIVLQSPIWPASKKKQVIQDIVDSCHLQSKVRRFLLLLNEHHRINLLDEIVTYLPYAWKEKKGIIIFEVRSAVPLEKEEAEELRQKLASLESSPVDLDLVVDPALLAGISLKKGNVVYDASIKGQLNKIKAILSEA